MRCYHGTTTKGLAAILSGCNEKPGGAWTVSDNDGCFYVWPEDKLIEQNCLDDDDVNEYGINQAFESAQCQAVCNQDDSLICIVLDISDDMLDDDYSCENMGDQASYIYNSYFKKSMIKKVLKLSFNKWHSPYIATGLIQNNYFNKFSLDPMLLELAEALTGNSDCFIDEIYDFSDYVDISKEVLK